MKNETEKIKKNLKMKSDEIIEARRKFYAQEQDADKNRKVNIYEYENKTTGNKYGAKIYGDQFIVLGEITNCKPYKTIQIFNDNSVVVSVHENDLIHHYWYADWAELNISFKGILEKLSNISNIENLFFEILEKTSKTEPWKMYEPKHQDEWKVLEYKYFDEKTGLTYVATIFGYEYIELSEMKNNEFIKSLSVFKDGSILDDLSNKWSKPKIVSFEIIRAEVKLGKNIKDLLYKISGDNMTKEDEKNEKIDYFVNEIKEELEDLNEQYNSLHLTEIEFDDPVLLEDFNKSAIKHMLDTHFKYGFDPNSAIEEKIKFIKFIKKYLETIYNFISNMYGSELIGIDEYALETYKNLIDKIDKTIKTNFKSFKSQNSFDVKSKYDSISRMLDEIN